MKHWCTWGIAIGFAVLFTYRGLNIAQLPAEQIVSQNVIIDDGFYYLQVARNLATGYGSTFDRINPTNGYQPIWAFVLAPIFWFTDDPITGMRAALWIATVMSAVGMLILFYGLRFVTGPATGLLTLAYMANNPYFLQLFQGGLETPVYFLLGASVLALWVKGIGGLQMADPRWCYLFGIVLGLTVLSRIDAALMFIFIGAAAAIFTRARWFRLSPAMMIRRGTWIAGAATCVIVPWMIWGRLTQGCATPVSGLVKRWVIETYTPTDALWKMTEQWRGLLRTLIAVRWPSEVSAPPQYEQIEPMFYPLVPMLLYLGLRLLWSEDLGRRWLRIVMSLSISIGICVHSYYMFFIYKSASHWNYHYFFMLALFCTVVASATIAYLVKDIARAVFYVIPRPRIRRYLTATAVTMTLAYAMLCMTKDGLTSYAATMKQLTTPVQQSFRFSRFVAAQYMRDQAPEDAVWGAWWAGTLGYLSGKRVVNLDGVINSCSFFKTYLKPDRVDDYIVHGPITHLIDFFWSDPQRRGPSSRAFFWENDKEHILFRLRTQQADKLVMENQVRFRGESGMYVFRIHKGANKNR